MYLFIAIYSMSSKIISQGRKASIEGESVVRGKAVRGSGSEGIFG